MRPSTVKCLLGLAVLLTAGAVVWWQTSRAGGTPADDEVGIEAKKAISATAPDRVSLPVADVAMPGARSDAPREVAPSRETAARVSKWAHDRGYPLTVQVGDNGALSTSQAFSGYDSAPDDQLKMLAAAGDPRASMVLGARIRAKYGESSALPPSEKAEATQHLLEATLRGYTASLEHLVLMKQPEAAGAGTDARPGKSPLQHDALMEGYIYAYLLEKRGDVSGGSYLAMMTDLKRLSPADESRARNAAADLYAQMNAKRGQLGLSPFEDGVPPDVQTLIRYAMRSAGANR